MMYKKLITKRNLQFFVLVLLSGSISSQSFDEAYLKSLPEEMQSEVIQKLDEKEQMNEPIYKRPLSRIDKISDSKRFGINIFNSMQTSFMPINEPNLDSDYILDFGDVLEVQLIGQKNYIKSVEIKRDGSISLEGLEKIFLSGLTLNKATELIQLKVANAYIGTKAFISLTSIRDIQVYIVGLAFNPGLYTLNGNSNVLHALSMAGGVTDNGSLRKVQLRRNGELIKTFDFYELFINGRSDMPLRLRSGDVILIPPAHKIISIFGGINRELTYELLEKESISDLINFSNGLSSSANISKPIRVLSVQQGSTISAFYDFNEVQNIYPQDNDSVYIEEYLFKEVSISGAVKYPGKYILSMNKRLSDLIIEAGGYREDAYVYGGILQSDKAEEYSLIGSEMSYQQFLTNLIESGIEFSPEILSATSNLKTSISSRVIANFDLDTICDFPEFDTLLQNNDEVIIPSKTQQVYVYGAVNSPGAKRHDLKNNLSDYIKNSGGLSLNAEKNNIYIVHPNGESTIVKLDKINFFGQSSTLEIYPGSFIFVTPKINLNIQKSASLWAPIVSSFALTLASIASLDNN